MSKKDVLGSINFGYSARVILPLEEAHKIQAILAKYATGVSMAYRSNGPNTTYYDDYPIPSVEAMDAPRYDCRGMTSHEKLAWADAIKEADRDEFLTPQEFMAIRGDNNG